MGSSNSKAGSLAIEIRKEYYYPGDNVQGIIYIDMNQTLEAAGLELTLHIIESVNFAENENAPNESYMEYQLLPNKPRILEGNSSTSIILYQNSWIIAKFNENAIMSGQYAYPFEFILPNNLPGSFEYYDENNTAYIKYLLTAKLITLEIKEKDVCCSALLIVRQSPRSLEYPTQLSNVKNIKNWCCVDKGLSTLNIAYPKNHYHPDESVKIICTVDNTRCLVDTNVIRLQLIQNISMKDSRNNTKFLCRKVGEQIYKGLLVLFHNIA
jgi:hypothetical protein